MTTTISVEPDTLERFNELKPGDTTDPTSVELSADAFLNRLLDQHENGDVSEGGDYGEILKRLEQIQTAQGETVAEALEIAEQADRDATIGYEDVVAASRQALREELPQGALQG